MTRTVQRAFSGGIMSQAMWARRDIQKWHTGVKDAVNVVIRGQGGLDSRAGTSLAGGFDTSEVAGHQYLIPFEASDDDTYMLEFGDAVMRVLKNGSYVLNSAVAGQTVTAVTSANPAQLTMFDATAASQFTVGRLVYLLDPNGSSVLDGAVLQVIAITSAAIDFEIVNNTTLDTTSGDWGTIGSGALLYEVYETVTPYDIESMPYIQGVQDVDTMFFANGGYQQQKLIRNGADDDWTFSTLTFAPEIDQVTGEVASRGSGTGSTTYNYKVAAVSAETGEEGLPSGIATITNELTTSGNYNTIVWTAVTDASHYRLYKEYNGIYGYIGITEALTFDDENITPDTAQTPQTGRDPFDGSDNWPTVASFIDQRLTFASTPLNPQVVETSASTTPFNFNRALTPNEKDAISFRMRSRKLDRVRHIIDADQTLILTAGSEWFIKTTEDNAIAAGNFALRPRSHRGSARIPEPVLIGGSVLHVTRDGNTIREMAMDQNVTEASADMTLLARHLFEGKTITSWAYQQAPDSILWVTLADGSLYSMTYLQEHEVWGWTRHELGGTDVNVKQVAVVKEGAYDVVYLVVSRTLQSSTVTLTERLDTRQFDDVKDCYFVDAGGFYDFTGGSAVTEITGLLHLRSETVNILLDGNVVLDLVVSDEGVLTLPNAGYKVAVGLPYDAFFIALDMDFGDQIQELGGSTGRFMAANEVAISVVNTRGIAVGLEGGFLNEVKEFTGVDPIPLSTTTYVENIEGDWSRELAIEVRQVYPLPMSIIKLAPSWTLGE